jgi:RHS repeat-associated protein
MKLARLRPAKKQDAATWKEVLLSEVLPGVDAAGGRRLRGGEGLIYFNARYYDPVVGRFLTEDPSRQGVNWYAYCENDPVNRTDPTGKQDVPAMLAGAGMMLGGVAIGLATVLLDVGTGGVGVVADPLLIAASVSLFGAGAATWSAGAASKWIPPASRPGRGSSNAPPIHLPQVDPIGTPPDPPSPSGPGWKGGVAAAIGVAGAAGVLVDALKRPNAPPPPAPAPSTAPTFTAVPKATVKLAD